MVQYVCPNKIVLRLWGHLGTPQFYPGSAFAMPSFGFRFAFVLLLVRLCFAFMLFSLCLAFPI
jgi:hypothetical protein